jgi:hypothetical protein
MENGPFIVDLPIENGDFDGDLSIAMLWTDLYS